MAGKKHTHSIPELSKPYEENEIRLKGIIGFGIGLLGLILVTFALMWALLNVLEDYSEEAAGPKNPMAMSDRERLPPEPRLQLAPGFGVESETGRVNLELGAPQAEWRELRRQWDDLLEHGHRDATTAAVTMMPIEAAKARLLEQHVKAKSGAEAESLMKTSRQMISESSAGRLPSETRR